MPYNNNILDNFGCFIFRAMQTADVLIAMKNYGMEEVAFKNLTAAIIFIKR